MTATIEELEQRIAVLEARLNGGVHLEDPAIANPKVRRLLAHTIDHAWRDGKASLGYDHGFGNPKAKVRGGVSIVTNGDTGEVALGICHYDEETGQELARVKLGDAMGRFYCFEVYGENGVMGARPVDLIFRYGAIDGRISEDPRRRPPVTSFFFTEPRNLNSGKTGWHIGFNDVVEGSRTRMVQLRRRGDLPPDAYVMFIDPKGP